MVNVTFMLEVNVEILLVDMYNSYAFDIDS